MKLLELILFLGCTYIPPPISGHCCHKCIKTKSIIRNETIVSQSSKGCSIGCSGYVEKSEDTCESETSVLLQKLYIVNHILISI